MGDIEDTLEALIKNQEALDEKFKLSYEELHKRALEILTQKKELRDRLAADDNSVTNEEIERLIDEYPYSKVEDMKGFEHYMKREFLFDCLRDIVPYAQKTWGKTSVIKLLKKAYLERRIFSESQQEELGDMVSTATSKVVMTEKKNMTKKYIDEKIKATPSDNYYAVTDGRAEVYGVGDLDEWATRQFGLAPQKR